MKVIDLTHFIDAEMPVFPGTPQPVITNEFTIEKDGYREKRFEMMGHTGTHIDAPAHGLADGITLDKFPAEHFYGNAVVVDASKVENGKIDLTYLMQYETDIDNSDFVLFRTDWCWYWGEDRYFDGFPVLTEDAANWLVSKNLKGVGFDCISADDINSVDYPVHKILLSENIVFIENLNNLYNLPQSGFIFSCLPLKVKDADGSPVRAVGIVGNILSDFEQG